MRAIWFILKLPLKILMAPVILSLTLFVWICVGIVYVSGLVLGLISMVVALLGVAVLITYSLQNGITASVATINADPYIGSCTFWDGVGKVQDGDQWILIDTQGNVVVDDPGFSDFYSCGNGLIAYQDAESGLWGYMTTDGKIAIEARFLSPDTFFPAD